MIDAVTTNPTVARAIRDAEGRLFAPGQGRPADPARRHRPASYEPVPFGLGEQVDVRIFARTVEVFPRADRSPAMRSLPGGAIT